MPGFTTHYLFGVDAFKNIPYTKLRQNIYANHSAYALGLQGPDIFFYYLPSYLFHKDNLGTWAHSHDTGSFFAYLLESRTLFAGFPRMQSIADAYICGFLGHYTLDSMTHPFVYANTAYDASNPPSDFDYFGKHTYLETDMDNALLLMKKQMKPNEFRQAETIRLTPMQKAVICRMLRYAYRNAYPDLVIHDWMIYGAFFCMFAGTSLLHDPSGRKKVLARLVERYTLGHAFISPMVISDTLTFHRDPLNLAHRTWIHPWTNEAHTESFIDLYHNASRIYNKRLLEYYKLISKGYKEKDRRLLCQEYGNLSFLSGQPID